MGNYYCCSPQAPMNAFLCVCLFCLCICWISFMSPHHSFFFFFSSLPHPPFIIFPSTSLPPSVLLFLVPPTSSWSSGVLIHASGKAAPVLPWQHGAGRLNGADKKRPRLLILMNTKPGPGSPPLSAAHVHVSPPLSRDSEAVLVDAVTHTHSHTLRVADKALWGA